MHAWLDAESSLIFSHQIFRRHMAYAPYICIYICMPNMHQIEPEYSINFKGIWYMYLYVSSVCRFVE